MFGKRMWTTKSSRADVFDNAPATAGFGNMSPKGPSQKTEGYAILYETLLDVKIKTESSAHNARTQ